ncbi:MAG: DMT family transporter [Aurantibacter sp.]
MKEKNFHIGHLLEINLAILFISTSGALGRYIDLPVPVTIGVRAILVFLLLALYCRWKKISFKIQSEDRFLVFLGGVLMGLHWVTYFYALQWSNVAIGMLSLFTYPVITSFLEPLVLRTRFQKVHLLLGALLLCGIYFLVPDFNFNNSYSIAVAIGIFSAICYAIRNLLMKSKVSRYHGSILMCYQSGITGLILMPALIFTDFEVVLYQWKGLVALALLTTAIGHTLFLNSFKHFSITTASILSGVTPVYGIIIGALFLSEIASWPTIFGGILILVTVLIESIRSHG